MFCKFCNNNRLGQETDRQTWITITRGAKGALFVGGCLPSKKIETQRAEREREPTLARGVSLRVGYQVMVWPCWRLRLSRKEGRAQTYSEREPKKLLLVHT